ncbi:MAG: hypothetical protein LBS12_04910 [Prevotellaceae bacterium]|jgi:DNA-directed RNA polymerase specialized sigma24 family protein|nr:hypothetical protein [Prevotellaceae bacterium]
MGNITVMVTQAATEIIVKEWEKQELSYLGFSPSFRQTVIADLTPQMHSAASNIRGLRKELVPLLYARIGYARFVERQKEKGVENPFARTVRTWLQRQLDTLRQQSAASDWDAVIKTRQSLPFYLTALLLEDLFQPFYHSTKTFFTPDELKGYFWNEALKIYPLRFEQFIVQLRRNDSDFWNCVCELLNKLASHVTKAKIWSSTYRDIAKDEVTTESYVELNRKVRMQEVAFNDAVHFRHYAYRICVNKMHEYCRRNKKNEATDELDAGAFRFADENIDDAAPAPIDCDVENEYEMARLAALILLDTRHPLHRRLVEGRHDKVLLLIDVAVNGLSYDEIIEERYNGAALSDAERKRLNENLRQECTRIKKNIVKQLKTILQQR